MRAVDRLIDLLSDGATQVVSESSICLLIANCLFSTVKLDGFDNGLTMKVRVE